MQFEERIEEISFPEKPWRIFFWEVLLFSLTFILGIASAFRINQILKIAKIPTEPISLWQFIISFLFVSLTIFLIIKFLKFRLGKEILFKSFFVLTIFFSSALFFEIWLDTLFALILTSILIFYWLKAPDIFIHNSLLIFGMAGIGSAFGLKLEPLMVVILLTIFSIYDVIAVYKTKHMVKIAKEMIESGAILGMIFPTQISEFKTPLKVIKPGGKFLILGGGDIVFPLLLASSLIPEGISNSVIITIFALFGLFLSFWIFISQKTRQPIPALPPIALFSIIGFLITRIL